MQSFGEKTKVDFTNYNNTCRAIIEANSPMISSKSAFAVSCLSVLIKARPHNLS